MRQVHQLITGCRQGEDQARVQKCKTKTFWYVPCLAELTHVIFMGKIQNFQNPEL